MSKRRLVRVIIADPDENVPVANALLHDSGEIFTDKTDQELFFDVALADLLKQHNERRITFRDKSIKDREQMLEEARIRDLTMVVIDIADL